MLPTNTRCNSFAGALLASLLLCGCGSPADPVDEAPTDEKIDPDAVSGATAEPVTQGELSDSDKPDPSAPLRDDRRRMTQLAADINAAQMQQNDLRSQRAAVIARMESHQEEGMAMLDSLKAEMARLQALEAQNSHELEHAGPDARLPEQVADPQFSSDARSRLEEVLAQDQAFAAELQTVDAELTLVDSQVEAMAAELDQLRKAQQQRARAQ